MKSEACVVLSNLGYVRFSFLGFLFFTKDFHKAKLFPYVTNLHHRDLMAFLYRHEFRYRGLVWYRITHDSF